MAKEVLVIPEHRLAAVVRVIRAGVRAVVGTPDEPNAETVGMLLDWCDEEEVYLARLADGG